MNMTKALEARYTRDNVKAGEAQRKAQEIAFAPVIFQVSRVMLKSGVLKYLEENPDGVTMEEIAEKLDIPVEDVVFAMDAITAPVSLFEPVYSDGADPLTVMDQVRDNRNTEQNWMEHITLAGAFRNLNSREKQIQIGRAHV